MRRGHVADGFGLFLTLTVDYPPVRDDLFVRRLIVSRDAAAKARVKPSAILIAALQINIGRESQSFPACLQNCDAARARIEPNVENVCFLAKIAAVAFTAYVTAG